MKLNSHLSPKVLRKPFFITASKIEKASFQNHSCVNELTMQKRQRVENPRLNKNREKFRLRKRAYIYEPVSIDL